MFGIQKLPHAGTSQFLPPLSSKLARWFFFWLHIADNFLHFLEGLCLIDIGAFLACSAPRRTSLPCTLTSIIGSAFRECSSPEVVIPAEGIQTIRDDAFRGAHLRTSHSPSPTTLLMGLFEFPPERDCGTDVTPPPRRGDDAIMGDFRSVFFHLLERVL